MNNDQRNDYITRDVLINLLSDDEVARVSDAEASARLQRGDEYVDLEHPGKGVCRFGDHAVSIGAVLPRRALTEATWMQIVRQLSVAPTASQDTGVGGAERSNLVANNTSAFSTNLK